LCLLRDDVPARGGVWTAAAAMAEPLVKRLTARAGLAFRLEEA